MQFTRFTDLGLRVAMQLAAEHIARSTDSSTDHEKPSYRVTAATVSDAINASHTHVAKVVSRLVELGVVRSTRGRTGGISLLDEALDFPLGNLVQALEGDQNVLSTFRDDPLPIDENCRLVSVLARAQEDFYAQLNRLTIRDISIDNVAELTSTGAQEPVRGRIGA
ncbi:transcriptional regulator [Corynebacterium heidelbergense]|uniref:Transcriptional regulator n=2 Tax=Corynebacterium heidelbergense TaxID=2055947 RepID=A0A364V535_9CORY|nr:transcriptional regulator [Corynebacterium heidelbergense]